MFLIQGKSEHAAIDAPEALEKCKGVSAHCKTLLPITKIKLRPLEFTPLEIDRWAAQCVKIPRKLSLGAGNDGFAWHKGSTCSGRTLWTASLPPSIGWKREQSAPAISLQRCGHCSMLRKGGHRTYLPFEGGLTIGSEERRWRGG